MNTAVIPEQGQQIAAAWYRALDVHAPLDECRWLADNNLNMQFPDGDIHDFSSFQRWYGGVTNRFFDEKHTIQKIEMRSSTAADLHCHESGSGKNLRRALTHRLN